MQKPLLAGEEIFTIIPQQPPFTMIDTLNESNQEVVRTGFTIKEDNPLVKNGFLQESGLIENIAQSAAAGIGYDCKVKNQPVPLGFIGAVKRCTIYRLPCIGNKIHTEITVISNLLGASVVHGEVFLKDECIAECDLNIFLQKPL